MTGSKEMPIIQIRCRLSIITLKNLIRLHNKMGGALCNDGLVLNSLELIQINLRQGRILLEGTLTQPLLPARMQLGLSGRTALPVRK